MATAATAAEAPKSGGGMKKIIIIGAVVALVVVIGGVALLMYMSNKAKAEDADGGDAPVAQVKKKAGEPPVFVPLDAFTVNLADKEIDRFAQIGVTLQVTDAHAAEDIKAYMPAIRSNVLVLLSHKTSADLLSVEGKEKLADEVKHQANIAMGIEDDSDDNGDGDTGATTKKKKKRHAVESPISQVLFSSFIVQ